ncbi:MAG: hypothetical protein H7301_13925 [Cryobacterium sp.]|nr:hypothetical protein [Oligoflexia bacterium]
MLSTCAVCLLPSEKFTSSLPCSDCLRSLLRSPPICETCLGLACPERSCSRAWMKVDGVEGSFTFASLHAAYLSIGPGARVLKSWKKSANPKLEQLLAKGVRAALPSFGPEKPVMLIPVPQNHARKWELDGGSVLRVVEMMLGGSREWTSLELLTTEVSRGAPAVNQARTKGSDRYLRASPIRGKTRTECMRDPHLWNSALALSDACAEVVLVDDFLTSGHTLRSAVSATKKSFEELGLFAGIRTPVHVFVLGFRPTLFG